MFKFNSFVFIFLLSGCTQNKDPEFENIVDALTVGILLEETRSLIPAGTVLRNVYQPGINLTKESEGFRNKLYNDAAGYCTIGYGHLIKKSSCNGTEDVLFSNEITEIQGEELLVVDMNWAKYMVGKHVSVELTEGQYAALVDFVFNVGSGNFVSSTLLQRINAGQHGNVPFQFKRWVKAGGKEWPGLVTRRENEINLYLENTSIPRLLPQAGEELSEIDIRIGEIDK